GGSRGPEPGRGGGPSGGSAGSAARTCRGGTPAGRGPRDERPARTCHPTADRVRPGRSVVMARRRVNKVKRPRRGSKLRQSGQGLVEYALILVLVALVVVGVLTSMGTRISAAFTNVLKGLGG